MAPSRARAQATLAAARNASSVPSAMVSPSLSFGLNDVHVEVLASSGQTSQASPLPSPSLSF